MIHYPIPPHKQNAYKEWNNFHLPLSEQIHDQVLSLPVSQVMDHSEAERVVSVINSFPA
jgi:dTDP-4-amino-4,6-dideoxygalactose transaminase